VVTQHYDTLQAVGSDSRSNLILLPNAPSAATEMLSSMITSFAATSKLKETDEAFKRDNEAKKRKDNKKDQEM
jgi:hypothetical protein